MALLLDGKKIRDEIAARLKREISKLKHVPALAILQVGDRPESTAYINAKKKFADAIGARVEHVQFQKSVQFSEIKTAIRKLNDDPTVHGIILQLPLPETLNAQDLIDVIDPRKDVDGLTAASMKNLLSGKEGFMPATAKGVLTLLDHYKIEIAGKHAVIVGRSYLVGKPAALSLLGRDATVTVCHSRSGNLAAVTKQADILVVAAGRPGLITRNHVREGQTVVDVGINAQTGEGLQEEIAGPKLIGDVDFEEVEPIVAALSPVPGGVGPMTVASLFENLIQAVISQG